MLPPPPISTLVPYTTLFRSDCVDGESCHQGLRMTACQDTLRLIEFVGTLWPDEFPSSPKRVGVVLANSETDRKSTRLNSSHVSISYAVFCLKKKKKKQIQ